MKHSKKTSDKGGFMPAGTKFDWLMFPFVGLTQSTVCPLGVNAVNHEPLRPKLVSYIKILFRNLEDIDNLAEDIVNEGYLNFYKSARYCAENENFGYLSAICKNVAYRCYNRQKEKNKHTAALDETVAVSAADSVDSGLLAQEAKREIDDALSLLNETERQVIRLRYYEALSFAQISERLGLNCNTALSHHRRALQKLRCNFQSLLKI